MENETINKKPCACSCDENACNTKCCTSECNCTDSHTDENTYLRKSLSNLKRNVTLAIRDEILSVTDAIPGEFSTTEYIKHELKFSMHDLEYSEYSKNIAALTAFTEMCDGVTGNAAKYADLIKSASLRLPITPLTFDDSEFSIPAPDDPVVQNMRNSRVFKNTRTGAVHAIGALKCETYASCDISAQEKTVIESPHAPYPHHCHFYLWDSITKTWLYTKSSADINTKMDFIDESFTVPVIELYDSNVVDNDYYAFIAKYEDIPADFFRYFKLSVTDGNYDSDRTIAYLTEIAAHELLTAPVQRLDNITAVEYTDETITVYYRYHRFLTDLRKKLYENNIGWNYAKIMEKYEVGIDSAIVLRNDREIKDVVESLKNSQK